MKLIAALKAIEESNILEKGTITFDLFLDMLNSKVNAEEGFYYGIVWTKK